MHRLSGSPCILLFTSQEPDRSVEQNSLEAEFSKYYGPNSLVAGGSSCGLRHDTHLADNLGPYFR